MILLACRRLARGLDCQHQRWQDACLERLELQLTMHLPDLFPLVRRQIIGCEIDWGKQPGEGIGAEPSNLELVSARAGERRNEERHDTGSSEGVAPLHSTVRMRRMVYLCYEEKDCINRGGMVTMQPQYGRQIGGDLQHGAELWLAWSQLYQPF